MQTDNSPHPLDPFMKSAWLFMKLKDNDKNPHPDEFDDKKKEGWSLFLKDGHGRCFKNKELAKAHINKGGSVGLVIPPGFFVIDWDIRDSETSIYDLKMAIDNDLIDCLTVRSGGGGTHTILRVDQRQVQTEDMPYKLPQFPGIQILRGGKNYIVGPGSTHPSGNRYEILDAYKNWDINQTAFAPPALLELLMGDPPPTKPAASLNVETPHSTHSAQELQLLLDHHSALLYTHDRDGWRDLCFAAHHATGGSEAGRKVFMEWSATDPAHPVHDQSDPEQRKRKQDNDKCWNRASLNRQGGITYGHLHKQVRKHAPPNSQAHNLLKAKEEAIKGTTPTPQKVAKGIGIRYNFMGTQVASQQLINGLVEEGSIIGLVGRPKAGKSFLALHMAVCLSHGKPFFDRQATTRDIIYIAAEGDNAIRSRLGLLLHRGFIPDPEMPRFGLVTQKVALAEPDQCQLVIDAVKERQFKEPPLLIYDTLAKCSAGIDENNPTQMETLFAGVDHIRNETGATSIVVHHEGKDKSRGPRGANSFTGAIDTWIRVDKEGSSDCYFQVVEQRNLPFDADHKFRYHLKTQEYPDSQGANISGAYLYEGSEFPEEKAIINFRATNGAAPVTIGSVLLNACRVRNVTGLPLTDFRAIITSSHPEWKKNWKTRARHDPVCSVDEKNDWIAVAA